MPALQAVVHAALIFVYIFALCAPGAYVTRWLWVLGMEPVYSPLPQYIIHETPVTLDWRGHRNL